MCNARFIMLHYLFSAGTTWNIVLVILLVIIFIVTQMQRQNEKKRHKANFTVRNIWLNRVLAYEYGEQYLYEMTLKNTGEFAFIEKIISHKEGSFFSFQSTGCSRDSVLLLAFNVPSKPGSVETDRIPPYDFTVIYRNRKGLVYRQSFKSLEPVKKTGYMSIK